MLEMGIPLAFYHNHMLIGWFFLAIWLVMGLIMGILTVSTGRQPSGDPRGEKALLRAVLIGIPAAPVIVLEGIFIRNPIVHGFLLVIGLLLGIILIYQWGVHIYWSLRR